MQTAKPIVNDMPVGGWTDRCPAAVRPYLKLMRLDRPIGTWLLLLPCWWSAALAAPSPSARLFGFCALFGIGAVIMRGAGCAINDIADRDFDGRVERTATRPIPSGQVSVGAALIFVGALMLAGLAVLTRFDRFTVLLGAASVPVLAVYPFMKRITDWPQAWLGLAFNWGALVGWSAMQGGSLDLAPAVLYAGGICWTLGYDTIYAHQDKADDVKIGVRSSALALGERTRPFLVVMYSLAIGLFAAAFALAGTGPWAWPILAAAALHLAWQVATVDIDDAPNCLKRFKSNRDFGLLVALAALAGQM